MKCVALVAAFVLGLIVIDRGIGAIMHAGFSRIRTGELGGQVNDAIEHRDRSVIVFGNSLTKYSVSPTEIQRLTGESCFNAGCNGQGIYYTKNLQALLLKKNTQAKTFICVFDWHDLYQNDIERVRLFAPFVDESPQIKEFLCSTGTWQSLKYQSHAYRYNSIGVSIVRHLLRPEQRGDAGFFAIDREYSENPEDTASMKLDAMKLDAMKLDATKLDATIANSSQQFDTQLLSEKLKLYNEFILAAKQASIETVFVIPPTFRDGGYPMGAREQLALFHVTRLAAQHDVPLVWLDESTVVQFQDEKFFGDQRHLNARGAKLLSRELARHLIKSRSPSENAAPVALIAPALTPNAPQN
ncbi:MAG: hypothetical protein ACI9HK_002852 [Pirellulaceae bacterium]|jgi:hypothetical protein